MIEQQEIDKHPKRESLRLEAHCHSKSSLENQNDTFSKNKIDVPKLSIPCQESAQPIKARRRQSFISFAARKKSSKKLIKIKKDEIK